MLLSLMVSTLAAAMVHFLAAALAATRHGSFPCRRPGRHRRHWFISLPPPWPSPDATVHFLAAALAVALRFWLHTPWRPYCSDPAYRHPVASGSLGSPYRVWRPVCLALTSCRSRLASCWSRLGVLTVPLGVLRVTSWRHCDRDAPPSRDVCL